MLVFVKSLFTCDSFFPFAFFFTELTESERASPQLKPYPNWAAHKGSVPQIVSPFHIKVDSCQRLWAIDTGIEGILNGDGAKQLSSPRILIFNLTDDTLIRQSELKNIKLDKSIFSNIVVDDNDCDDSYAYVADAGIRSSLTVYSYKSDKSWQFEHHYFNIDPLAGNFSILGVKFQTNDGLYGLSLTEKKDNGFPVLYFHALTSLKEFNVSTAILRNETLANQTFAKQIYKNFTYVGSRRTNEQAGATAYHKSRHVFFYALPNMNEIGCSRINTPYNISNVFSSPVTMVYPSDVKIDAKDRVWVLSNNMQNFRTGRNEQANAANFYVQVAPINEAVKNTPCEQTFMEKTKTVIDKITGKGGASTMAPVTFMTFITSIAMLSVKKLLLH